MGDDAITSTIPPWYPLVTEPGAELRALRALAGSCCLNAYLPMIRIIEMAGHGYKRRVVKALLPGYVFAHLPERFSEWDQVRSSPGVYDFLRVSGRIVTISERAINYLRAIEADVARPGHKRRLLLSIKQRGLEVGDTVTTTGRAGSWAGYEGVIQSLDAVDRATIEIILPGRSVRATLPAQWLKAVTA